MQVSHGKSLCRSLRSGPDSGPYLSMSKSKSNLKGLYLCTGRYMWSAALDLQLAFSGVLLSYLSYHIKSLASHGTAPPSMLISAPKHINTSIPISIPIPIPIGIPLLCGKWGYLLHCPVLVHCPVVVVVFKTIKILAHPHQPVPAAV